MQTLRLRPLAYSWRLFSRAAWLRGVNPHTLAHDWRLFKESEHREVTDAIRAIVPDYYYNREVR